MRHIGRRDLSNLRKFTLSPRDHTHFGGTMRSRPTLPHLLTGLALLILPVACSRAPGTPAPAAGSTLTPLTLGPGTNTLQYEPFLSATNGWGPVERNHSNGEQAAGDGKTLTLNGVTYP